MFKRTLLVLSLVLLAGMAIAACGGGNDVVVIEPGEPIHIGYMLPTSGGASVYGESAIGAMNVLISQRGQLLGHDILLTGEDTECSAEGGETAAQRTVADPTIVGVIGTTCSSAMTAAMTTMSESGLTVISPSNTSPALTNPDETWQPGYFRTAHNDLFQGAIAAQYAIEELGASTAAAIHDGDPYTEGLATAFTDNFTKLGGTVTTTEAVNKGDTDMRSVLTTVAADSPDVLFFPIFQPEADFIVAQSVEIPGLENTILFSADGSFVAPFAPSAGQAALGMYFSGPYVTGDKEDTFQADYLAANGTVPPGPFGEHAADGLGILLNAIEAVAEVDDDGTLRINREELREAVEATTDYDGITGLLSCGPKELVPGVTFRGDCATGEALGVFQANQAWIDSEDAYPPDVLWTP
ncbi:MAG: ABC transporter substrate-binding protein [Chloroflexi bacterium]|nr:ABC transporter substrate-binding protein [Chloroflexota bacterium]